MKKEYNRIKKLSKGFIESKHHKKLSKIEDHSERTEGLKYLIGSKFKTKLIELESKIKEVDSKDSLIPEAKLIRLYSKVKIFESTHSKSDFEAVQNLINEIEEDLNYSRKERN